ncbi:MAG: tetratricopeptide repeat protein, partial [Thermoguttaceae bacterium]|nr:tetratricopeptide repeat protein [Thermoguttaceae bacterium]
SCQIAGHAAARITPRSEINVNRAKAHFQTIIAQGPTAEYYKEATFHYACEIYNDNLFEQAKPLLETFLQTYPTDAYAQYVYYYLGVCESRVGNYPKAQTYFDSLAQKYPDSPLRWLCALEKSTAYGKAGDFASAEQILNVISAQEVPAEVAGSVVIQRALIQVVQQKYDAGIQILEAFIAQSSSNPALAEAVQDAYLYEAYCYYAKHDFQRALLVVENMERGAASLNPSAIFLKVELLAAVNRVAEAEELLNKTANSTYGVGVPDLVASYRGMLALAKGDWDGAIQTESNLLRVSVVPGANAVTSSYFSGPQSAQQLDSYDYAKANGVLILAYASRYAASKNENDNIAQLAVYNALQTYVLQQRDPALELILRGIDQQRSAALANPIRNASGLVFIGAPGDVPMPGQGGFANPADSTSFQPSAQPGATGSIPGFPQTGAQAGTIPGFPQQTGTQTGTIPGFPQQTTTQTGTQQAGYPQQAGTQQAGYPQQQPGTQQAGYPQQQPGTQQAGYPQQQPGAQQPGAQPGTQPGTQTAASRPLTPTEARDLIDKATKYYQNQEFDRANETLLGAMTISESFWTDCPAEAARIALLRANALFALNNRLEARQMCQSLVDAVPYSPEAAVANFYLGYGSDYYGRADEAVNYLRKAANSNDSPFLDSTLYLLGMNEWERGNIREAERVFARLYREFPNGVYQSHASWALAKIEFESKNYEVAEDLVNEALQNKPDAAIVENLLFLKGEIAFQAKDYEKAKIAFEMIVNQYPDGAQYSKAKNRLAMLPERFQ